MSTMVHKLARDLCAGARLGGGERLCCYTSMETEANFPLANSLKALQDCLQFFFMLKTR